MLQSSAPLNLSFASGILTFSCPEMHGESSGSHIQHYEVKIYAGLKSSLPGTRFKVESEESQFL